MISLDAALGIGGVSTLLTLGIAVVTGLNMSLLTQMIVIMVTTLSVSTAVHL